MTYWRPVRAGLVLLAAWVLFAAAAPRLTLAEGALRGLIWGAVIGCVVALKNYGQRRGQQRG